MKLLFIMYRKIIDDLVKEVMDENNHQNFLLRNLFYIANKFTISSAFRTQIPGKTAGLYAFVEEKINTKGELDYIIRYVGRAKDIQKRLLQHEKDINRVLEDVNKGIEKKNKYFAFAKKLLENPKSYAIYIWRWKNPRSIHEYFFNGKDIDLVDAEGIIGGLLGEVFGEQCYNREFISTSVWAMKEPNKNYINRFKTLNTDKIIESKETITKKWAKWCDQYITEREIPLFYYDEKNNQILTEIKDNGDIRILRHPEMEELLAKEVLKIYNSYNESNTSFEYDGLIYLVYTFPKYLREKINFTLETINEKEIIPLYIGKTETIGVNGKYSVNIKSVQNKLNKTKFARWGDASAYHIGDLSDALFANRKAENFTKYKKWAEFFFEEREIRSNEPVYLKFPVYFWAKAWHKNDEGLILNLPCTTCFLERQLISIIRLIYPELSLNSH